MSGGKKTNTKTYSDTNVDIPEYMKPYMTSALGDAQSLYQQGKFAPKATRSAETLRGNEMALSFADLLQGSKIPQFESQINDLANTKIIDTNEFRGAVDAATRPVMDNLARYAIPGTQDAAVAAGQRGSSRQGIAEGLARSDANSQILDATSRMSMDALGQELENKRMGISLTPQLMQLMTMPSSIVSGVGASNDAFNNGNARAEADNYAQYANLLKMFTPQMDSTTNQSQTTKEIKNWSQYLGDVMGGVGGFMPQGQGGAGASGPFASILKFMTTGTP